MKRAISFDPDNKNRGKGRRRGKISVDLDSKNLTGSLTFVNSPELPENGYLIIDHSNRTHAISEGSATPLFWPVTNDNIVNVVNNLPLSTANASTTADAFKYLADNDYYVLSSKSSEIGADGLVLELDASRKMSYPGTSTTWYDLSGNGYNATLNNGPTFDSESYISFDGVNDYGTFSSEYSFDTGDNDYTFEILFKMRTLPTAQYGANGHIWGGENGNDVVMYLNPASGGTSRGIMVHDDSRYNTGHMTNGGFEADTWAHWVAVGDSTNDTITHYINGQLDREDGPMLSSQQNRPWGGTRFAYDSRHGTYSTLDLAIARQYNRQLTAEEVAQNFYKGPIVTNGLTLALDASNLVSYESGSSVAYSLIGNDTGSLTNGLGYNSNNGGTFEFDGTNDYIAMDNLGLSSHTIEGWFNSADGSQGGSGFSTICSIFGNYDGGSAKYTYIGLIPNLTFRIDDGATSHAGVATVSYSANTWYHVALTYDATSGATIAYVNGAQIGSRNSTTNIVFNSIPHNIGKTQANTYFDGQVASHKTYNRALSSNEIMQNFNAHRSRFSV